MDPVLAARRLDRRVGLPRRRDRTFGRELVVVDERFHRLVDLFARRVGDERVKDPDRAVGQAVQDLATDPNALIDLAPPDAVSRIGVPRRLGRHVERKLRVHLVRERPADVVRHAGRAKVRTGHPARHRIGGGDPPDADGPGLEDRVFLQQVVVLREARGHPFEEATDTLEESRWDVRGQAADADKARHHPHAGQLLHETQDLLALPEGVDEHARGGEIDRGRAEPDQVRADAMQLGDEDPEPARARWGGDPEQLFHRVHVREVVRIRRQVVDPVGERDRLMERPVLHRLLDPGVQEADIRVGIHDDLAVELEEQPEDPMGRGMLRPHVQEHRVVWRQAGERRAHRAVPSGNSIGAMVSRWTSSRRP